MLPHAAQHNREQHRSGVDMNPIAFTLKPQTKLAMPQGIAIVSGTSPFGPVPLAENWIHFRIVLTGHPPNHLTEAPSGFVDAGWIIGHLLTENPQCIPPEVCGINLWLNHRVQHAGFMHQDLPIMPVLRCSLDSPHTASLEDLVGRTWSLHMEPLGAASRGIHAAVFVDSRCIATQR